MTDTPWDDLNRELAKWRQADLTPTLWWRDDDAQQDTPALQQLLNLSADFDIPLLLACIPLGSEDSLPQALRGHQGRVWGCQHGYAHHSHSTPPVRKSEYPAERDPQAMGEELLKGKTILSKRLGTAFYPAFVPPWNRVGEEVPALLADLGYAGFSGLGEIPKQPPLPTQNVHIDIIDWKLRQFRGTEATLAQLVTHLQIRRQNPHRRREVTGLMTHHLDHDDACWAFCRALFEHLQTHDVRWLSPEVLFSREILP